MISISVVIPLYNKSTSVVRTINSVLAQTVLPLEIVVVDDGSTDNGVEIIQHYLNNKIRLFCQSNQGVSAARNKGVQYANGSHIAFLDADDEWLPNHIEYLSKLIRKYPQAAMFSTAHQIRRQGEVFEPRSPYMENWIGLVSDFFLNYSKGLSLINSSTACVRKDALICVGGFPVGVRRGEDLIVWIKLALKYPVAHYAIVTAVFNQEAANRSDLQRESEPPGSLQFMANLLNDKTIEIWRRYSIGALFDHISLVTSANFRLNGDRLAAGSIGRLAFQSQRYGVAIKIALVNILPAWILRIAKRLRHRKI